MTLEYALNESGLAERLEEVKGHLQSAKVELPGREVYLSMQNFLVNLKVDLSSLEEVLQEKLEDSSIRFTVFENITKENANVFETDKFFIQIFLTLALKPVQPLSDPFYLIEANVYSKEVELISKNSPYSLAGALKINLDGLDVQQGSKELSDNFLPHFINYILELLTTLATNK